jgi:hypothetical protein
MVQYAIDGPDEDLPESLGGRAVAGCKKILRDALADDLRLARKCEHVPDTGKMAELETTRAAIADEHRSRMEAIENGQLERDRAIRAERALAAAEDRATQWELNYRIASEAAHGEYLRNQEQFNRILDAVAECDAAIERERTLRRLLQRIHNWDQMDVAGDGAYWRAEIDAALKVEI